MTAPHKLMKSFMFPVVMQIIIVTKQIQYPVLKWRVQCDIKEHQHQAAPAGWMEHGAGWEEKGGRGETERRGRHDNHSPAELGTTTRLIRQIQSNINP